jgi:biotin transport system substrate-specific component
MTEQTLSAKKSISLKIALTAVMCALTCSGGFIKIPLPMLDITLQTFFACMAGLFLGKKLGALSQAVYMILGLLGVPVFSRGGGIAYLFQPSFGFILGFILCAFICGAARDWLFKDIYISKISFSGYLKVSLICLLGIIGVYLIGAPYMLSILSFYLKQTQAVILSAALSLPMYLLGDIASLVILILAAPVIFKRVPMLLSLR